jgi:hypothetical protein
LTQPRGREKQIHREQDHHVFSKPQKRLPDPMENIRCMCTPCAFVLCRNSVIAMDLAISKEMDTFHPHKQTRLYGITIALSQCPQGNIHAAEWRSTLRVSKRIRVA